MLLFDDHMLRVPMGSTSFISKLCAKRASRTDFSVAGGPDVVARTRFSSSSSDMLDPLSKLESTSRELAGDADLERLM
jgi:hypothetical protein